MPAPEPLYFSRQVSDARRFHLPPGRSDVSLAVAGAGWEACRADYEIRRTSFSHLTVEFVAKGEGMAELAGERFPLRPGVIYVYDRTVPHWITAGEGGMVKYFALLRGSAARKLLARRGLKLGGACMVTRPDRIREIWDDLIEMGFGDRSDREEACADTLRYLILKIGDLTTPEGESASLAYATYQRCRETMEERYAELVTVSDVARVCGIDPAYMCRLFLRFGRQNPYRYLLWLRVNHAVDLLRHTSKTARQVAEDLNFSDASTFSRTVKRVFGLSPSRLGRMLPDSRKGEDSSSPE